MKALFAVMLAALPAATAAADMSTWARPTPAFHITGPIYYVGTQGLAAYLIKTHDGAILIDATLANNVPAIERNIAAVDVPLRSVKILLNGHAHFDHAAGFAQMKRDTGAKLMIMREDARAIRTGQPEGDNAFATSFPGAPVDHELKDGERVTLGGVTLTAWRTAGHTKGCTTWTTTIRDDGGKARRVIFPCSLTVAGNVLIGNKGYPGIVQDFRASFARLKTMQADIVLTAHPEFSDVFEREARAKQGVADAFVDPGELRRLVDEAEQAFNRELAAEKARKAS